MLYGIVSNYAMDKNISWYLMANKDFLFKIDCWVIECNLSLWGAGGQVFAVCFKIVESVKNMILKGEYKRRLILKLFLNLIDSLVGYEFYGKFFLLSLQFNKQICKKTWISHWFCVFLRILTMVSIQFNLHDLRK